MDFAVQKQLVSVAVHVPPSSHRAVTVAVALAGASSGKRKVTRHELKRQARYRFHILVLWDGRTTFDTCVVVFLAALLRLDRVNPYTAR